jgi:hypothetical protein
MDQPPFTTCPQLAQNFTPGFTTALHSAHCSTELWPQLGQKRASADTSVPHFPHFTGRALPQAMQALAESGLSAPHLGQQEKGRPQFEQNFDGLMVFAEQAVQIMNSFPG